MHEPQLLDRVRAFARVRRLSIRTEQAYADWIRRFILSHEERHPAEMGEEEVRQFLSHLAVEGKVAASAQNVALCALLFLYRHVFGVELPYVGGVLRAKRPPRVPVVFTREEVDAMCSRLPETYRLVADLLYGAGPRPVEVVRVRLKDLDFAGGEVLLCDGKGAKDRRAVLPRPSRSRSAATWGE
jgi:site-specific recombinase XerD